ncbi:hypothetical protein Q9B79_16500 [Bacillus sp. MHSD_36]|uniref:hypothetical protein n=1 Tax=unclassified Bacillus (in: firmicutes) TaxID=185979 RepID=UPI0027424667|nr:MULTISPECIES: hypothetical protein [unclassified Bacillus (in: firmicutes)]MDP7991391.1 hypothetical protein [Bacillus sp. MHSD_36]MDR4980265.1 hypothetical protein [Bacillus sp. MHSD_37]
MGVIYSEIGGDFKFMKQGINQTGPTCGLYSIVNGLLIMNKISNPKKEKIDKVIYELLKNFKFEIKDEKLTGYTLVGEFFIFDIFTKFIEYVIQKHDRAYR